MENKAWDWKEQSRYFLAQAVEQQRQLWEVESQAKTGFGCLEYQERYDRTLAAFSVYHHLWGRPFLRTREKLIAELEALLDKPICDEPPYDQHRLTDCWKAVIEELIEKYRN